VSRKKPDSFFIGKKFERLTVLELDRRDKKDRYWLCRCECGNEKVIAGRHLGKATKSCGCLSRSKGGLRAKPKIDIVGRTFESWTVLSYAKDCKWICECVCGKRKSVSSYSLRNGKSKSCGCFKPDKKKRQDSFFIGKRFDRLVVLSLDRNDGSDRYWLCRCDCGNEKVIAGRHLLGKTKSCGCLARSKFIDLTGRKFGRWTVLSYSGKHMWKCRCECGVEKEILGASLKNGSSLSCGCYNREVHSGHPNHNLIDLIGQRFGRLVVQELVGYSETNQAIWLCKCDCGKMKKTLSNNLRRDLTQSCGCLHKEAMKKLRNPNITDEEREEARNRRLNPKNGVENCSQ